LSKTEDYLADNICVPILSEVMHWAQEESGRRSGPELGIVFAFGSPLTDCQVKGRGRLPRRPHLYRERKGGPAPELDSLCGVATLLVLFFHDFADIINPASFAGCDGI
jgi:hypothetical protein